jgi:Cu(I)/Ag(I) efflux system periplasmic protein CusF
VCFARPSIPEPGAPPQLQTAHFLISKPKLRPQFAATPRSGSTELQLEMKMKKLILIAALSCAAPVWASPEWVRGEVTKLDLARKTVTLKHGPIASIQMDAMTMPFKVKDAALLTTVKVGDHVRFHVLADEHELVVQQIEVQP